MAFEIINFSPVGNNARAGNVPQVFSYVSNDLLSEIIAPGYFNELAIPYLRRGDWIDVASDVDGTDGQSMRFVLGDGSVPSALSAVIGAGGASYAIDDLVTVTYVDGTVVNNTILRVLTINAGAVLTLGIEDPGFFSVAPTTLATLATTTGGSGTGLTVTVTLAGAGFGLVTLSELSITAA